jgi:thioredoxin 1
MITRRSAFAAPLALFATIGSAQGADKAPFTQAAFEAAKQAGRPVLVEVTAPWCPTCKAQKPILSELTADPKFKELAVLEIDFDSQKDALRTLKVQQQSTLITFKGGREVGRSTGDTNKSSIASLLDKAI